MAVVNRFSICFIIPLIDTFIIESILLYGTFAFIVFLGFGGLVTYLMCKYVRFDENSVTKIFFDLFILSSTRQMKLNNELNNMSWRVRPDEVLLEVGRLFGSKIGLQKLNFEVSGLS